MGSHKLELARSSELLPQLYKKLSSALTVTMVSLKLQLCVLALMITLHVEDVLGTANPCTFVNKKFGAYDKCCKFDKFAKEIEDEKEIYIWQNGKEMPADEVKSLVRKLERRFGEQYLYFCAAASVCAIEDRVDVSNCIRK